MVRLITDPFEIVDDDELPELTEEEKAAMDSLGDWDQLFAEKIEPFLPAEQKKPWAVTDRYGCVILRFHNEHEAVASAIERNERAKSMGLKMRYRIHKVGL